MITFIYVLISSSRDFYYEQALLSIFSLRLYNPDERIILLTDATTEASLHGKRSKIKEYISEIQVVKTPEEYTPKERSRYIKTTFRQYLTGDLLFIDTDTIITGKLSDINKTDAEIACVLDYHATLDKRIDGKSVRRKVNDIFNQDITEENYYYNSGIIFVRDTPKTRSFFEKWHKYWEFSALQKGQSYDQPSFLMADRDCGHIVKELDGAYNCQILTSFQYLHNSLIIHFFNNFWEGKSLISPFFQNEIYDEIKSTGEISKKTKQLVLNCKAAFISPIYYTCSQKVEFLNTIVGATLYSLYKKNGITYKLIQVLCNLRYFIIKNIGSYIKKN